MEETLQFPSSVVVMIIPPHGETAAESLLADGLLIDYAGKTKCPRSLAAVGSMSLQHRALAQLVYSHRFHSAILFAAIVEGWSVFKIRFELNKLSGKAGK